MREDWTTSLKHCFWGNGHEDFSVEMTNRDHTIREYNCCCNVYGITSTELELGTFYIITAAQSRKCSFYGRFEPDQWSRWENAASPPRRVLMPNLVLVQHYLDFGSPRHQPF